MKKLVFLLLISFSILSCVTQKKVDKYIKSNPDFLLEKCALNFPTKPIYVKGDVVRDTIEVIIKGDEMPCDEPSETNNYKPTVKCPDVKERLVTERVTDTIFMPNLAKEQFLSNKYNDCYQEIKYIKSELTKKENTIIKQRIFIIALGLFCLLLLYFTIKK